MSVEENSRDGSKLRAAQRAVEFVKEGQIVGLGTGSTAGFAIRALGQLVAEGLSITGVPTSAESERLAREVGIRVIALNDVEEVDITIDGADEIDPAFNMIKGGGGALIREKLVAVASRREVIVVDRPKLVRKLGESWPVPVEVLPFGRRLAAHGLAALGCLPKLRERNCEIFVTDNGNHILDCEFGLIDDAPGLEKEIRQVPGVVESGLFIGLADTLVVGGEDGAEVRQRAAGWQGE